MKKINKLITILFIFAIVSFFSFAKGDECDNLYNEYNNCLSNCRHDCMISNPIDPESCISQCTGNCNTELNTYENCVSNGEGEGEEGEGEGEEGEEGEGEGEEGEEGGDSNCENYGTNRYYDPAILTCIECTKPLINDSCESYVGNRFINDLGTCCEEGDSCPNPSESGVCPEGFNDVAGCCQPVCGGNTYLPEGSISMSECKACESGTMPNADHTKCVCDPNAKCCGVQLNTVVPFIGDCIEFGADSSRGDTTSVNSVTAFPILMQGLMKIVMSVIMVFSFIMVIVAGLMMTTGAVSSSNFDKGKTILKNVIISLILLGCSGLILSLVNPSFFGG